MFLRQRHPREAGILPDLGKGLAIAAPGAGTQAQDDQDDQEGVDQVPARALSGALAGRRDPTFISPLDHADLLGRAGGGSADSLPAGSAIAAARLLLPVDECLRHQRAHAPAPAPVIGKTAGRQQQRAAGQVPDPNPWQHQEPAVPHDPRQAGLAPVRRPSDPCIADRQRTGTLEHQAAEAEAAAIKDETGKVAADRRVEAARMIAVHEFGPFGQLRPAGGDLQRDRPQLPKRRVDRFTGLTGFGAGRRSPPVLRGSGRVRIPSCSSSRRQNCSR